MPTPPQENSCFAHYHMTLDEYGLWTHAREISHESKVFYFDGRKIAARFAGTGKDRPYRIGKRLVRKGWFALLRPPKRLKNGMFAPGEYYPLSHDEWSKRFGTDLCFTCPQIATGSHVTSPQIANDLSSNCERPVAKQGHNLKGLNRNKNKNENKSVLSSKTTTNGQAKTLLNDLAVLGNDPLSVFDEPQTQAVVGLLSDYSSAEIKAAFRELWEACNDDFAKKHFARTFAAKAAQVIPVLRHRQEQARQTEKTIARATQKERSKALAELAALQAAENAEAALVEETLGS